MTILSFSVGFSPSFENPRAFPNNIVRPDFPAASASSFAELLGDIWHKVARALDTVVSEPD